MPDPIPSLSFRIEPGYTFPENLSVPQMDPNNLVVGNRVADSGGSSFFLGRVAEYGRNLNVWLDYERAHAVYVMGKRRSGKTYTLGVMLEGLASNQWIRKGDDNQAILVVDTMNVFITMPHSVLDMSEKSNEVKEAKKWGLRPEQFNIVLFYPRGTPRPAEGEVREITVRPADLDDKDWTALFGLDTYSDPMGQVIAEAYEKVAITGYDSNGHRIDKNAAYSIDDLLECLGNSTDIQNGYQPDTIRGVRARFNALKRQSLFSETGIPVKDLFLPGQLSILLVRDLDQNLRSLLIGILVKKIMELRSLSHNSERLAISQRSRYEGFLERGEKSKAQDALEKCQAYEQDLQNGLLRGWIVIDEAHNYMPAKDIVPSAEPLRKYVNEGRNLGLSIVVATQNPSALDPSIRRNSDVLIIHSISMRDDIAAAEGMINTRLPDSFDFGTDKTSARVFEQLVRSLPIGYAVVSNELANRVFVTKVRPRITVHGGAEY